MEKSNLLFRASGVGALAVQKQGAGITEIQSAKIKELEEKFISGKPLTTAQETELMRLKAKRDAPPELSDTAKAFVRKLWLWREKGIRYEITSKYLEKGLWSEHAAISLLQAVLGRPLTRNTVRMENGVFTGLADIIEQPRREGHDTKCSWNAETFMNSVATNDNEWQGRIYMELYDLDVFNVQYCLVDAPEHVFTDELFKWKRKHNIIDHELPEHKEKFELFRRGLIYSDNPRFTLEERVKTFTYYRDEDKINFMLDQVELAVEYYKTLSLNGVGISDVV